MKTKNALSLFGVVFALALTGCGSNQPTPSSSGQVDPSSSEQPSSSVTPSSSQEEGLPRFEPVAGEDSIAFHYQRDDKNYKNWNMWIWESEGKAYDFNYQDDYGVVAYYPLSSWTDPLNNELGFIVRRGDWEAKDVDADRFVNLNAYDKDDKNIYNIYLKTGDPNIYYDAEGHQKGFITSAQFTTENRVQISGTIGISSYKIKQDQTVIAAGQGDSKKKTMYVTLSDFTLDYTKNYTCTVKFANNDEREENINMYKLFSSDSFNEAFAYDGELGAIYTSEKTTFKVWSPFSSEVKLRLYDTGTPLALGGSDTPVQEVAMIKGEKGVFEVEVEGDLDGKYYTYLVTNAEFNEKEAVDPYARSAGINGLRGMVVNFNNEKAKPAGWDDVDYLPLDRKELTVYETHVADVTSSETWTGTETNRKLFKGMYEPNTTYTEGGVTVKTGFDHIKELGINAVQILPFFDQDNDEVNMSFNWGYNPLNYNCLEGGYSSNAYDGYARIKEFKELVKAYNEAGIEIIMDVVYNHTSGAKGNNFDILMPGYYYRHNANGSLSNGSGCGNETASENYMFRKFMIDSVNFWLKEYKLGGFRFDLMGLHDIETMNQVAASAKAINPHVTIYGEPWTGGTSPLPGDQQAKQANANDFVGYGQFNDQVRNALHGGVFDDQVKLLGWADTNERLGTLADRNKIANAILGTTHGSPKIADPEKTTNYVTCHDNRTLFDRIVATTLYDAEEDYEDITKMITLAHGVVFLSNGTSFMLAGEEFARTKGGDSNSYKSSYKVNELDYSLKVKNLEMFNNFAKLIELKQTLDGFHYNKDEVAAATELKPVFNDSTSTLSYTLNTNGKEYKFFLCNGLGDEATYDLSGYELVLSSTNKDKTLNNQVTLDEYEILVVCKTL